MALTAPMFLMKHPWARKRTRDLWGFWYLITHGDRFVGRRAGLRLLFDLVLSSADCCGTGAWFR